MCRSKALELAMDGKYEESSQLSAKVKKIEKHIYDENERAKKLNDEKRYDEALEIVQESARLKEQILVENNSPYDKVNYIKHITTLYMKANRLDEGLAYLNKEIENKDDFELYQYTDLRSYRAYVYLTYIKDYNASIIEYIWYVCTRETNALRVGYYTYYYIADAYVKLQEIEIAQGYYNVYKKEAVKWDTKKDKHDIIEELEK